LGPGYRIAITDWLTFRTAAGFNVLLSDFWYSVRDPVHGNVDYDTMSIDLGAAADVGFCSRIGKAIFLSAGSIVSANFARWMWMDADFTKVPEQKTSVGWERGFFSFGIRPYITVGFDLSLYLVAIVT